MTFDETMIAIAGRIQADSFENAEDGFVMLVKGLIAGVVLMVVYAALKRMGWFNNPDRKNNNDRFGKR
jgi:branched-subunit amino acid permease